MAYEPTWPKCSDVAQRYILQQMRNNVPAGFHPDITDPDKSYDGEEEWSIGSVFDDGALRDFEDEEKEFEGYEHALEVFGELDEVYDAIKITDSGGSSYDKLEGLKAFSDSYDADMPTDNKRTRSNWIQSYKDAGLLEEDAGATKPGPDKEAVTERGHAFIETTEALNRDVFHGLGIEAGDFYRKMFTQGYGDSESHTGDKIQAFFLFSGGMNPYEVSRDLDVPESTVRRMADYLEQEGLFTGNNMFTPEGRDLAETVLHQLDDAEPEGFDEGTIETELGQDEEDFFNDDGMLDL